MSEYHPDSPDRKRKALNNFLLEVGISPIKKTLTVDWDSSSERTKSDYIKKAQKTIKEVLSVLAPNQEMKLETELLNQNNYQHDILKSIANCFDSLTSWGVQRQILSIVAFDYTFNELLQYIPSLTRYKYTAARKHAEEKGHGVPVKAEYTSRQKISNENIEHFLDFVMSPTMMTDTPFGENSHKLSNGQTLIVPKIILNSVRTRTVNLYLEYCTETQYTDVLSERTYMRILEAVEPNIRKSMKGLDNYAADGAQGFDDLRDSASTIGQMFKGHEWTENMKKKLHDGKNYLKLQYKVRISLFHVITEIVLSP